jgi:hypothetical protein
MAVWVEDVADIRRSRVWMERRYWSRCRARQAEGYLKFRASRQSKKSTLRFEEDLRNQYNLGYTPDRTNPGEGFHKISVKTKQKDLVVHAREEYYWGQ